MNIIHLFFVGNEVLNEVKMAVPKKKTSKSRRNMRRSHIALKKVNPIIDKETGEYKLPHHICLVTNSYKGKQVKLDKSVNTEEQ